MNKSLAAIPQRELFRLTYQTGTPLSFEMQIQDVKVQVLTFTHRGTASNRSMNALNGSMPQAGNRVVLLRQDDKWGLDEVKALSTGSIRERLLTDPYRAGTVSLTTYAMYEFDSFQSMGSQTIAWRFQPLEFPDIFEPHYNARVGDIEELYGPVKETRFYHFLKTNDNRPIRNGSALVSS